MDYNANICLRLNCQEKPTDKFKQYGKWVIFLSNHQNILNKFTSVENFKEKKILSTIFIKHEVWQILMQT